MFLIRTMIDFRSFENIPLRGGFIVLRIEPAAGPLRDALGREAIARTRIVERRFEITMKSDLAEEEQSVTSITKFSKLRQSPLQIHQPQ